MNKYLKGPWRVLHVDKNDPFYVVSDHKKGTMLAQILNDGCECTALDQEKVANLIAAVPDLLEVLEQIIGDWEDNECGCVKDYHLRPPFFLAGDCPSPLREIFIQFLLLAGSSTSSPSRISHSQASLNARLTSMRLSGA